MSRACALLCLLALMLAGCGSSAAPPRSDRTTLRWAVVGVSDLSTLDPALVSDAPSISVASLVYGGLVRLDSRLRVRPDGATRWTISRDGRVYTFYLRKDLRFADGTRVTAEDFVAALDRALGPEASSGSANFYLSLIAYPQSIRHRVRMPGVQALGPHRLRIVLRHAAAHFLTELAFPVSDVPEPSLPRRFGSAWTDHAAGFGPYSVVAWQHGRSLTLIPNRYYYGVRPTFSKIVIHFYPDAGEALVAYRQHRLDVISGFEPGQDAPVGFTGVTRVPALALDYLAFNTTRYPFHHLNARRAFATVAKTVPMARFMGRSAFPAGGFLPPALGILARTWRPSHRAVDYLRLAHYSAKKPLPAVTFAVLRDPHVYSLAVALQQAWQRKLGVTVLLHQLDASTYDAVLNAHGFDLAIVRWGGDYPDPQDFLATQLGTSTNNVTGWTTRRYARLLSQADDVALLDPTRRTLFQRAGNLASRKLPLLPLDVPSQTALISPQETGIKLTPLGTITVE